MKNYTRRGIFKKLRLALKTNKLLLIVISLALLALLLTPQRVISKGLINTPASSTVISIEPAKAVETVKLSLEPKEKITETQVKVWKEKEELVEQKLAEHFSTSTARIALAVLKHESGLNLKATNWNCWYDAEGNVYEKRELGNRSRSCKKEDRQFAWSMDCGIIQSNFVGVKQCPPQSYTLDWSLKRMKDFYDDRGFSPWVSYTSGAYLTFLK